MPGGVNGGHDPNPEFAKGGNTSSAQLGPAVIFARSFLKAITKNLDGFAKYLHKDFCRILLPRSGQLDR